MDAEIQIPDPSRYTFLKALQRALRRPSLWLTTSLVLVLLALTAALPWLSWFREVLDHRYAPGSLLQALDESFLFDQREGMARLEESTRNTGAVLALLAVLFGAFAAGGWLQVLLERIEGSALKRFFFGGSRFFFRFLRVLLLTLLSLQLASYVCYGFPWTWLVEGVLLGVDDLEQLDSELSAFRVGFAQDMLFYLAATLLLVWGDYTRTRLALHGGKSAVWAGLCSWIAILRHPVRTLRPMALLWLCEAVVLWGAWKFSNLFNANIEGPGDWAPLLFLFLLGQLVLVWRNVVRGARYAAALEISGEIVRAPRRPDPWKGSVGGPGGPQYPIDQDEYTISI